MRLLAKMATITVAALLLSGCIDAYNNYPREYFPRRHIVVTRAYHPERPKVIVTKYRRHHHRRAPRVVVEHLHRPAVKAKKNVVVTKTQHRRRPSSVITKTT